MNIELYVSNSMKSKDKNYYNMYYNYISATNYIILTVLFIIFLKILVRLTIIERIIIS